MAIIDLADVKAELPTVSIGATTRPNETQVGQYIVDSESEIRGLLVAYGGVWPATDDESDAKTFLRRTVLEAVRILVYRAAYAHMAHEKIPQELDTAIAQYAARLKLLPQIASSVRAEQSEAVVGRSGPRVSTLDPNLTPQDGASFLEWTVGVEQRRAARRVGAAADWWPT